MLVVVINLICICVPKKKKIYIFQGLDRGKGRGITQR